MAISPHLCSSELTTFRAERAGTALDIELRARAEGSFRSVGERGIAPIGEFADWSAAPPGLRAIFDKFSNCVERGVPNEVFSGGALVLGNRQSSGAIPIPWRLVGAAVAIGVVLASFIRRMRPSRFAHTVAPLVVFGGVTWAIRHLVFPSAFFHQNGHGAMWVDCALGERCGYGPGFRELFGWVARMSPSTAERQIFFAQSLLAATAPISAWVIARAVGAPRAVAWTVAFVLAIEPGLGRLAQSESYFGVVACLLFGAAALLASAARVEKGGTVVMAIAASGAGLLLGHAAVVHPIAWIPSALVPLVALLGNGSLRRRLQTFFIALAGTGLVALASSGIPVLRIYAEHRRWGESIGGTFLAQILPWSPAGLLILAALIASWIWGKSNKAGQRTRARRLALSIVVLSLALASGAVLHPFAAQASWIQHVGWAPYFPIIIASIAAIASVVEVGSRPTRWAAVPILIVGVAYCGANWQKLTSLPADVLESEFAFSWREELPEGARVFYLERAGSRISTLPIYKASPRNIRLVAWQMAEPGGEPIAFNKGGSHSGDYYYRSSLCTGEEVRPICAEIERQWQLQAVRTAVFPARPSMPYLPYDSDEVHVGLYRITGTAPHVASEGPSP